jgi:hypothetical protein
VTNGTGIGERALAATGQRLRDVELWRLRLLAHRTPRYQDGETRAGGNIEGQELPVLEETREGLANVEQMTVEYHGWPHRPQRLGALLTLLDEAGFRYHVDGATQWFALVHASRA